MRVIVTNDEGSILVDYSTVAGANALRPAFGEEGHSIAVLAETIQFLAPPLEETMPRVFASGHTSQAVAGSATVHPTPRFTPRIVEPEVA